MLPSIALFTTDSLLFGSNETHTIKSGSILVLFRHMTQNLYTNDWLDVILNQMEFTKKIKYKNGSRK